MIFSKVYEKCYAFHILKNLIRSYKMTHKIDEICYKSDPQGKNVKKPSILQKY